MKRIRLFFFCLFFLSLLSCYSGQIVYIFESGEKYHKSDCQYLNTSKIAVNYEEAKRKKYEACEVCKPIGFDASVQCSGTTKEGKRCKNKTKNANGKCHVHS